MTTTPATKILNKVYARHLIKVARGQSYASNPGGSAPTVTGINSGTQSRPVSGRGSARPAAGLGSARTVPGRIAPHPSFLPQQKTPGWVNSVGEGLNQVGRTAWNYGGKQTLLPALNAMDSIPTFAIGAANTLGGGVGNVVSGLGYGVGAATDAIGATTGAKQWVADNMWKHTNNAVYAGLQDMAGSVADAATGGAYDYNGTFADPGKHPGTAVQQNRSAIRDELRQTAGPVRPQTHRGGVGGRGQGAGATPITAEQMFNTVNGVSDFAASSAGYGGAGRGINIAARAIKSAPQAAPVLNAVARVPVAGRPAAATGNWLAGKAPEANMFVKSPLGYYQSMFGQNPAYAALGAGGEVAEIANAVQNATADPTRQHKVYNESRPQLEQQYQQAVAERAELFRGTSGTHAMTNAMMRDPAIQNRMGHGGVPTDAAVQLAVDGQLPTQTDDELDSKILDISRKDPRTKAIAAGPQLAGGQMNVADGAPQTTPQAPEPSTFVQSTFPDAPPEVQSQQLAQQQSQQAQPGQAADNYYGNRIQELVTGNAPPAELNSTFDEYLQRAGQNMPKEEYAQIQQNVTQTREQLGQLSPEGKQRVGEAITKPDSKAGQEVAAQGLEKHIQANAASAPENPQDFGGWMNQMVTQFQSMDQMSQIGMGLGLGAGVLGMLSGLGGGGIGSFLLGALGLGAAGFMGANAGMFGEGGQNFADDLKFNVGSMLGMIPEVKRDELAPLLTKDPMAALSQQAPKIDYALAATDPEGYAKTVAPQIQQAEAQLGKLEQLAGQTPYMLMKVSPGLSAEEAQLAITNAKAVLADAKNPQGQLGSQLALAREFMADPVAVRNREAGNMLGTGLANAGNFISGLWKGGSDMNIAQQIIIEQLVTKAARCWAGYEPVPGKKPYSNDSCRPVGSKKKKKKKAEKKAAGPVLPSSASPPVQSFSKTPFDAQHMIQTLGMHASTKPHLAYNKAMNLWENNKFTPAQFSALHEKYQGLPPQFSQPTQNPNPAPPASTAPMTGAGQAYQQWRATQGL